MALKEIAVLGATIKSNNGATASIVSLPSTTCKAGAFMFKGTINIAVLGGQSGTCVGVAGTGTIDPTATKVKADGSAVCRKGDTGSGTVNGVDSGTGSPCSFSVDLEIDAPGQSKVKAE